MGEQILKQLVERLELALSNLKKDLTTIRTGRAKTSLVEDVRVEAYGTLMTIKELATIAAPDPSLITISPWDKSLTQAIATGINKAELNLQPVVDGEVVKLAIPPLTQERRAEMVKQMQQKLEAGRVAMRTIRTEIKEQLEAQEGESGVSEDDVKRWLESMQKKMDEYMGKIEQVGKEKEAELTTL